jgi:hypothetical protein
MTQYSDIVEEARIKGDADEWGKGVKYIHANNGIIETAFNNGNIHFKDNKNGRGWTVYPQEPTNLMDRFLQWKSDNHGK